MGGKVRKGTCIVSGVVPDWVREFLDYSMPMLGLESRSKVIGMILTEYSRSHLNAGGKDARF
jgi:hypothetical protein